LVALSLHRGKFGNGVVDWWQTGSGWVARQNLGRDTVTLRDSAASFDYFRNRPIDDNNRLIETVSK